MKSIHALAVAATALMAAGYGPAIDDFEIANGRPRLRERKNKYDLSSEEIEAMETMTPKEKKKFLKARGGEMSNMDGSPLSFTAEDEMNYREIEKLSKQVKSLQSELDRHKELLRQQCNKTQDLSEQLKEAREVIRFYGDRKNSCGPDVVPIYIYEKGAGNKARAYLEKYPKNESVV